MQLIAVFIMAAALSACAPALSPQQKEQLNSLKKEREAVQAEIAAAATEDARYGGGLIKSLIAVRLEILKTNDALLQQRIHALEGGAKTEVVVKESSSDPTRAKALAAEVEAQRSKLASARAESEQYSGGLVKALADTTAATVSNTVAMLEQERLKAEYGLVLPSPANSNVGAPPTSQQARSSPAPAAAVAPTPTAADCLKIETFDSSVLSANSTFTEVAWKADVSNSCTEQFNVRVVFTLYDKDEFELDSDSEDVYVGPSSVGKARGKMLVNPPEKARRMARQGVSLRQR